MRGVQLEATLPAERAVGRSHGGGSGWDRSSRRTDWPGPITPTDGPIAADRTLLQESAS